MSQMAFCACGEPLVLVNDEWVCTACGFDLIDEPDEPPQHDGEEPMSARESFAASYARKRELFR